MGYKVREGAGEVQVPRAAGEWYDVNGNHLGYRNEQITYYEGEVIPDEDVSPQVQEALENGDPHISRLLEKVGGEGQLNEERRAGLPFDGYDNLSVEDVVAALRVLPAEAGNRVKAYERARQNRPEIVQFDSGRLEGPADRVSGQIGSQHTEPVEKPQADQVTRSVEDDSVVQGTSVLGEGGVELSADGVEPVAEATQPAEDQTTDNKRNASSNRKRSSSDSSSDSSDNKSS
jgi:hypothetical protein